MNLLSTLIISIILVGQCFSMHAQKSCLAQASNRTKNLNRVRFGQHEDDKEKVEIRTFETTETTNHECISTKPPRGLFQLAQKKLTSDELMHLRELMKAFNEARITQKAYRRTQTGIDLTTDDGSPGNPDEEIVFNQSAELVRLGNITSRWIWLNCIKEKLGIDPCSINLAKDLLGNAPLFWALSDPTNSPCSIHYKPTPELQPSKLLP